MMRYLLLFSFLFPVILFAQTRSVSGQLVIDETDEKTKGLPYASVIIANARDSSFVKGVTSDGNGYFRINFQGVKNNKYLLKASYMGYATIYHELNNGETHTKLGTIKLNEADIKLEEVTITALIPPIEQIGDTTIINASVYKTPEGSYLKELVKRISGLDYNPIAKSLTYNGLPISEISVNGEAFFAGDITMALENLTVELIDKIKVYNKKSEIEKITGIKKVQENYVLDLQTKKEFNGALLTTTEAGYGNHNKKEIGLQINHFKQSGDNLSLIAHSGNRDMMTSYKDNRQDNIAMNYSKKFNKELNINSNINYNYGNQGGESSAYNEQYLTSGNKYQYSAGQNMYRVRSLYSRVGLHWQVDPKTQVYLSGNLSFHDRRNANTDRQASFSANPGLDVSNPFHDMGQIEDDIKINDISRHSLSLGDQHQYSFNASITHQINEKGSNIGLHITHGNNRGENEDFTISSTTYYRLENSVGNDSVLYRNQYQFSPDQMRNHNIGLTFSHPLKEGLNAQLLYNLSYDKQQNDRNTYDLSGFMEEAADQPGRLPPGYTDGYIDSLSNRSQSRTIEQEVALRLNYYSQTWDLAAGMSIVPERRSIYQKTGLVQADTTTHTIGLRPSLLLAWKKENSFIRLNYHGHTLQPPLASLLSLTDNSNPLNIRRGNPDLKPTYHQSVRLEIQDTPKGLFASLDWRNAINSQTHATTYNPQTGGSETYPININGNWSTVGMLRYQKRISSFNVSATSGGSFARNISLINEDQSEHPNRSSTRSTGTNAELRLSYTPQWGTFDLSGNWNFQHSTNSLRQTDNYTRNYSFGFNAHADLPGSIQLKTDALYTFRNGTNIQKNEDDQLVWNTGVTWRFLKKKRGELSVHWTDILSERKNYVRNTTAEGFYESHSQQIGSYFIVSMKYRFDFGRKE